LIRDPKVTVLMAVYNCEKYLRQAIESILGQTFSDFELLIIDDGSTDNSSAIICSHTDGRIRVLRNNINKGEAYSRKRALEEARGEYIAVLDADDIALPHRLEVQVNFMDTRPDIVLLGSSYEIIDKNGNVLQLRRALNNHLAIHWRMLFGNPICNSSSMFRRVTALEIGGYDKERYFAVDYDLWSRFAVVGKIEQLDEVLVKYRHHEESLVNRSQPDAFPEAGYTIIMNNIRLQTGAEVTPDVVRYLSEHSAKDHFSSATIELSNDAFSLCVDNLILQKVESKIDRQLAISLALDELQRISRRSSNSQSRALWMGLRLVLRHSPETIFSRLVVRFAWRIIVPSGMRKRFLPYYPKWLRSG